MLVHTPDKLQTTLDYLNYYGFVFYRDNEQLFQKGMSNESQYVSNIPDMERSQSNKSKIIKTCILCSSTITNDEFRVLGKNFFLCSSCQRLFAEITII